MFALFLPNLLLGEVCRVLLFKKDSLSPLNTIMAVQLISPNRFQSPQQRDCRRRRLTVRFGR